MELNFNLRLKSLFNNNIELWNIFYKSFGSFGRCIKIHNPESKKEKRRNIWKIKKWSDQALERNCQINIRVFLKYISSIHRYCKNRFDLERTIRKNKRNFLKFKWFR